MEQLSTEKGKLNVFIRLCCTFEFPQTLKSMNVSFKIKSLDKIDLRILEALAEDARKPFLEIAREICISGASVQHRYKKLKSRGFISGTTIRINSEKFGHTTTAFIGIFLDRAMKKPEVVDQLRKISEVMECHYTTGNWSILIKLSCRNNEHLMQLLNTKIEGISGVNRTETFISLNQQINRPPLM